MKQGDILPSRDENNFPISPPFPAAPSTTQEGRGGYPYISIRRGTAATPRPCGVASPSASMASAVVPGKVEQCTYASVAAVMLFLFFMSLVEARGDTNDMYKLCADLAMQHGDEEE